MFGQPNINLHRKVKCSTYPFFSRKNQVYNLISVIIYTFNLHDILEVLLGKFYLYPNNYRIPDGRKGKTSMEVRLERLTRDVNVQIGRIQQGENKERLEVIKLYFDGWNEDT